MRRVVITGMGMVTPLGCGVDINWRRLLNAESGITGIQSFDVSDLTSKIAGQVPRGETSDGMFNPDDWMSSKIQRRMDTFIIFGLAAAVQAVEDSGWQPDDEESLCRTGVLIGSGIGGLSEIEKSAAIVNNDKVRRLSPFFIPASLINLVSGQVSIRFGFKGPNHAVVTACSSGAHAIGDAARMIMWEDAEVMVTGGTEAAICRLGIAGFAQAKALPTNFNDTPEVHDRDCVTDMFDNGQIVADKDVSEPTFPL